MMKQLTVVYLAALMGVVFSNSDLDFKLWKAAEEGNLTFVNKYLAQGANPTFDNQHRGTSLHIASLNNHPDVIKRILEAGVDVNLVISRGGFTALHLASSMNNTEAVQTLLDHGADPNVLEKYFIGRTPLIHASMVGNIDVVNNLIAHGAIVDMRDMFNGTALQRASSKGYKDIVNVLLAHGADVYLADSEGVTPLHATTTYLSWQTRSGNPADVIPILIAAGADVNLGDKRGSTPLHVAARRGRANLVRILIAHGADVNLADKKTNFTTFVGITAETYGETPLMAAARKKQTKVAKILLKNGADSNKVDGYGKTAAEIAKEKGYTRLANIIDSYISVTTQATSPTSAPNYYNAKRAPRPIRLVQLLKMRYNNGDW